MVTLPHASGPGQRAHHEHEMVKAADLLVAGGQRKKSPVFHNSLERYTYTHPYRSPLKLSKGVKLMT